MGGPGGSFESRTDSNIMMISPQICADLGGLAPSLSHSRLGLHACAPIRATRRLVLGQLDDDVRECGTSAARFGVEGGSAAKYTFQKCVA